MLRTLRIWRWTRRFLTSLCRVIFTAQSLVLIVAVIVIIVVNNAMMNDATREQIQHSVTASSSHAQSAIKAPIDRYELFLNDFRSSYRWQQRSAWQPVCELFEPPR